MTFGVRERVRQRFLAEQDRAVDWAMLRIGTSDQNARQVAMLAVEIFYDDHQPMTSLELYELGKERSK